MGSGFISALIGFRLERHAVTLPQFGGVDFEREPGVDDEPGCANSLSRRHKAGRV